MKIPAEVLAVMGTLNEHGYESYVIGGAVRDALLNRPVHDYDLTTDALPEEMLKVFRRRFPVIPTGIKHGTVTVISGKMPVEVTTYRADSIYSDHRHPDAVTFTRNIQDDCARRDFTVNALCCTADSEILDFFDGQSDLKNGIIRCIGRPEDRLNEDALRILRAVRFAARFGFAIEPETSKALYAKKDTLAWVSRERIRSELLGLLSAPLCGQYLQDYRPVFEVFLPEIQSMSEESWGNTCAECDRASDPLVRLALLFKDFDDPEAVLRRLTCSTAEIRTVLDLITHRDIPLKTRIDVRRCLRDITADYPQYLAFRKALDPALDDAYLSKLYEEILQDGDCVHLKDLAVNGNDIMTLGYKGKGIRDALNRVLNAVIDETVPNEKQALLNFLRQP